MENKFALWSTGLGICEDFGQQSCRLVAAPPGHRVFSLPYRYNGSLLRTVGYGAIANGLLPGDDGGIYGIINVEGPVGKQRAGNCAFRTELATAANPSSYRGWRAAEPNGTDGSSTFAMRWIDPYQTQTADPGEHVCDPIPGLQQAALPENPAAYHLSPRRLRGVPTDGSWPSYAMLSDTVTPSAKRSPDGEFLLQVFFSYEMDYARAVSRWEQASQPVRLTGLGRWTTLARGGSGAIFYPTWLDGDAPKHGDDAYQSVTNGSTGSLYIYAAVGMPVASVLRHRVLLKPGTPAPAPPKVHPPTPSDCAMIRVMGAGQARANGVYKRQLDTAGKPPTFRQQSSEAGTEADEIYTLSREARAGESLWQLARPRRSAEYSAVLEGGLRMPPVCTGNPHHILIRRASLTLKLLVVRPTAPGGHSMRQLLRALTGRVTLNSLG